MIVEVRKCHTCGEIGHLARNYDKKKMEKCEPKMIEKQEKCHNCDKNGCMSMNCPSKALPCNEGNLGKVTQGGKIENWKVTGVVLDKGCSRTLVKNCFVREEKFIEGTSCYHAMS